MKPLRLGALLALLTAAFVCVLLTGCGAHTTPLRASSTATSTTPVPTPAPHPCNPLDATLNCQIPAAPLGVSPKAVSSHELRGLDFGWSSISGAYCHAHGFGFGASYLSLDASKNWTRSNIAGFHAHRCATVSVLENAAGEATSGYAAGEADARLGDRLETALGLRGGHIDFAIDCDCTPSLTLSYFQGADHILGVKRVGAYGGYFQVQYLCAAHVVTASWQTYAWSGGRWLPASCAPLEQYLNGSVFDYDRAIAANYGQAPAPMVFNTRPFRIYPAGKVTLYRQHVSERNTVETWWRHGCRYPLRRTVCKTTHLHLVWLHGRLRHIAFEHTTPANFGPGPMPDWRTAKRGIREHRIGDILNSKETHR